MLLPPHHASYRAAPWPSDWPQAVVVRGMADVERASAAGRPIVLLSPPGAALYAGVGWWRALADAARGRFPDLVVADVIDCADAPALALAAIRMGQKALILMPSCPAFGTVARIAAAEACLLLEAPPPLAATDP